MFFQKKEKQLKEVEIMVDSFYICDKCELKISHDAFDAFEFKFEYRTGMSYPECGSGEEFNLHLCKKCAPQLIEILNLNGFKTSKREWDW